MTTMNPAPTLARASRTLKVKPLGRPLADASLEKEYCRRRVRVGAGVQGG